MTFIEAPFSGTAKATTPFQADLLKAVAHRASGGLSRQSLSPVGLVEQPTDLDLPGVAEGL